MTSAVLPTITFDEDADLDGVGTVLGRLTDLAFTFTLADGDTFSGSLDAVEYREDGAILLDVRNLDTDGRYLLRLDRVSKIAYC